MSEPLQLSPLQTLVWLSSSSTWEPLMDRASMVLINLYLQSELDVTRRINKAKLAFVICQNSENATILTPTSSWICFASMLSLATYGCNTWKVIVTITQKVQAFINSCLHAIEVWYFHLKQELMKNLRADVLMGRRKWQWIGQPLRKGDNTIAEYAMQCNRLFHYDRRVWCRRSETS